MPDLTEDPLADYDPDAGSTSAAAAGAQPGLSPVVTTTLASPAPREQVQPAHEDIPLPPEPFEDYPPDDIAVPEPPLDLAYEDIPPDYTDGPFIPRQDRSYDGRGSERRRLPPGTAEEREEMAETVIAAMRDAVASMHHHPGSELIDLVNYMLASDNVLAYLEPKQVRTWKRVGEVLISCAADDLHRDFDLFDIPDLTSATRTVVAEVEMIRGRVGHRSLPTTPTSSWRALCDRVQRIASVDGARKLIGGVEADLPDDELMAVFAGLQPPTTRKTLVNASFSKSADDWEKDDRAAEAERPVCRISSGYPTLDWAFTAKNPDGSLAEPLGAWAGGELHLLAAPTGNGKSALSRRLITAAAEDLVTGWGHEHSKVLIAITEEAPKIVYRAAGLAEGEPFAHLAKNVVIADVGASRRRFVHAVWDLVIEAFHRSKETGMPIVDCGLPEVVVLDYVGGLQEGHESEVLATENTANLLMRGIAGWRCMEQEQFSGESFAAYAGMAWPEGMENFRPAVLGFVQFRKLEGVQFYDPENKQCNIADFTVENPDGTPGWDVKPGDFRVPPQAAVRGSGVLINHATSLTIMHRSRPQKNPPVLDPVTKRRRLADDRARFILVKTRNGADMAFVPMRFDSNWRGERGQFYDLLAERAVEAGKLRTLESYTRPGDPILPPRPVRSPFSGVAY